MAFWRKAVEEVLLDASKVDIVAVEKGSTSVRLYITHAFPWTGSDRQVRSLQDKIHTYVGNALDGELIASYPDTEGLPWRIVIASKEKPDARTASVVADVAEAVRRYSGDLGFE